MPTRISAGVGGHPCFLSFYYYDPKITNFSLYLILYFLSGDHLNNFINKHGRSSINGMHAGVFWKH